METHYEDLGEEIIRKLKRLLLRLEILENEKKLQTNSLD